MAALTLRILTNPGDTTKGAGLTPAEMDQNLIDLNNELKTKSPINSPTFTGIVTIPGGSINNTSIGVSTRSSGAFTSLTANNAVTFTANTPSTTTTSGSLVITGGLGVSGQVTAGSFSGNGASLTSLNASALSSGTVPNERLSGTYNISIGGNAGSVTNGLYSTGSYSNPDWLTAVAFTKITGSGTLNKNIQVISTDTTAVSGRTYVLTASLVLTLPASPTSGMTVDVINRSGTTTCVIARGTANIMGLAEDLTIDSTNVSLTLTYVDATRGWVFN